MSCELRQSIEICTGIFYAWVKGFGGAHAPRNV